jgi:hypothetical protein
MGVLAAIGVAAAVGFSVLLAVADRDFRTNTPAGVEKAAALLPLNTAYLSLRALQLEYDGGDSRAVLEKMVALDRYSSSAKIRLGLDAEVRGDWGGAEKWLLAAAEVDRQYEPRWTLANFYFRQGRTAEFWKWVRAALEVSYGDRAPAFDLCWQVSGDAGEVWSRAIPDRRDVVSAYLWYVLGKRRLEAVGPAALKLAAGKGPEDTRVSDAMVLNSAMDALLEAGEAAKARQVWVALGYAAPAGIVGTDFEAPRIGHGFDWRLLTVLGVTEVELDAPASLRIVMSGQEPETCELLRQFVIVKAGRKYVLRWEARTDGFPKATGLEWKLGAARGAVAASAEWSAGEMRVAGAEGAVVSLGYQRPSGEVRVEGRVELRHVTLTETAE